MIGVGVDERGLRIAYGPWAWPATRIPLSRIRAAWAEDIAPLSVGGWGYRVVPWRAPANSTVMVRSGDCLVVEREDGRRLAVSVDDAGRGASLLAALLVATHPAATGDHR